MNYWITIHILTTMLVRWPQEKKSHMIDQYRSYLVVSGTEKLLNLAHHLFNPVGLADNIVLAEISLAVIQS